jgi:hypothetical protein
MSLPLSSLSGARQLPRAAPSSPVFSHGWTVADGRRLQGAWRRTTRDPASPSRARLQTQPVRASAPFDSSVGAVGRRLVEAPRSGRGEPPKRHADVTEIRQNLALGSGMSGLGVERVEWSTVELACPVSLPRQRQCGPARGRHGHEPFTVPPRGVGAIPVLLHSPPTGVCRSKEAGTGHGSFGPRGPPSIGPECVDGHRPRTSRSTGGGLGGTVARRC